VANLTCKSVAELEHYEGFQNGGRRLPPHSRVLSRVCDLLSYMGSMSYSTLVACSHMGCSGAVEKSMVRQQGKAFEFSCTLQRNPARRRHQPWSHARQVSKISHNLRPRSARKVGVRWKSLYPATVQNNRSLLSPPPRHREALMPDSDIYTRVRSPVEHVLQIPISISRVPPSNRATQV